jgi:hypothetical protein
MILFYVPALFSCSTSKWRCLLFGVSGRNRFGAAELLFVR